MSDNCGVLSKVVLQVYPSRGALCLFFTAAGRLSFKSILNIAADEVSRSACVCSCWSNLWRCRQDDNPNAVKVATALLGLFDHTEARQPLVANRSSTNDSADGLECRRIC